MNRALPVLGSEKEANTQQIARYTNPNYLIYFEVENKQKSLLKTKENRVHLEGDKKNVPSAGRVESVFDSIKFVHI